jgi:hypothetical protein
LQALVAFVRLKVGFANLREAASNPVALQHRKPADLHSNGHCQGTRCDKPEVVAMQHDCKNIMSTCFTFPQDAFQPDSITH